MIINDRVMMQKSLLLIAVIAVLSALCAASSIIGDKYVDYSNYSYEQFKIDNKRNHGLDATEDSFRRIVFDANMHKILKHNKDYASGLVSWWMKPTQFTDRTEEEFKESFGYNSMQAKASRAHLSIFQQPTSLSVSNSVDRFSIDWTNNMPKVANQGQCGSCWAFATAATISGRMSVELNDPQPDFVSPQQITSCAPNPNKCGGTGGCNGATVQIGFDYVHNAGGIALDSDYSYTSAGGQSGVCEDEQHKSQFKYQVGGYQQVIPNNKTDLLLALQSGPVAISVAAASWSFYGGGIYTGCSSSNDYEIDHAVVLIAYGHELSTGTSYYTIRNSWGPGWGENGNIRVFASADGTAEKCGTDTAVYDGSACQTDPNPRTLACGECGLLYDSAFPYHITKV